MEGNGSEDGGLDGEWVGWLHGLYELHGRPLSRLLDLALNAGDFEGPIVDRVGWGEVFDFLQN